MLMASPLLALAAALVAVAPAVQAATVNTPSSLVQCQPAAITWSGASSSGSVYLSVIQGKEIGSNPLVTFATQKGASGTLTWPAVNISSGTEVTFQINDATGQINYSDQTSILAGDNSCTLVNAASSGSSSSSSSSGSSGSSSGSKTTSGSSSAQTSSSSSGSSSGAMAISPSGAMSLVAGVAGVALGSLALL